MRYTIAEKLEIISLVDGSERGVNRTLKEPGIHKSTFYNWYTKYQQKGAKGLLCSGRLTQLVWNKIPVQEREKVMEIALEKSHYSARKLTWHITDMQGYYISESSIYRILR